MTYRDEDPAVLRRQLDSAARRAERYRSLFLKWRQSRLLAVLRSLVVVMMVVFSTCLCATWLSSSDLIAQQKKLLESVNVQTDINADLQGQLQICRGNVILEHQATIKCNEDFTKQAKLLVLCLERDR